MKIGISVFIVILLVAAGGTYYVFGLGSNAPEEEAKGVETAEIRETVQGLPRVYNPALDPGGNEFALEFLIPEGWEVEYNESSRILNVFSVGGAGTSHERSQIVLSYFDASQFLTLSSVMIHEVVDLTVGKESYVAKRYDIEKKPGVTAFQGQPSWRLLRHIAVDFRDKEGFTRYFSIAKNPQLDEETFQRVLDSIKIVN